MIQDVADIAWDEIKNQKLLRERGISFEIVLERFLKTIIPSRKETQRLLGGRS